MSKRHGGKILADHLAINAVIRVFSVPGESFLAALDGLYDHDIQNVVCRQEGGAAMMAEAHAKLTGNPASSRSPRPAADNGRLGPALFAMQDSSPMVVFVGHGGAAADVHRAAGPRGPFFQGRGRLRRFFSAALVKMGGRVETYGPPARKYNSPALFTSAPIGPPRAPLVACASPKTCSRPEADFPGFYGPARAPQQPVDAATAHSRSRNGLLAHDRPIEVVVAGGPGWSREAQADSLRRFGRGHRPARRRHLPAGKITFDNAHPNLHRHDLGVGDEPEAGANSALRDRDRAADL